MLGPCSGPGSPSLVAPRWDWRRSRSIAKPAGAVAADAVMVRAAATPGFMPVMRIISIMAAPASSSAQALSRGPRRTTGRAITITIRRRTTVRQWFRRRSTGTTAPRPQPTIPTCRTVPAAGSSCSRLRRNPTDPMATKPEPTSEIKVDPNALFLEEIFTDRRVGTIRRLTPVKKDGNRDPARAVLYIGETQVLTPAGALPIGFEIGAGSLEEAAEKFGQLAREAIERTVKELQELRRQAASQIVVPQGPLPPVGPGGGGKIQMP